MVTAKGHVECSDLIRLTSDGARPGGESGTGGARRRGGLRRGLTSTVSDTVGDPIADGTETDTGALYAVLAPLSGSVDLSTADGIIAGTVADAGFGRAMSSADADGDGAQDLLIASAGSSQVSSKHYLLMLGD